MQERRRLVSSLWRTGVTALPPPVHAPVDFVQTTRYPAGRLLLSEFRGKIPFLTASPSRP